MSEAELDQWIEKLRAEAKQEITPDGQEPDMAYRTALCLLYERELKERMRVNVGLLTENRQLKAGHAPDENAATQVVPVEDVLPLLQAIERDPLGTISDANIEWLNRLTRELSDPQAGALSTSDQTGGTR